MVDKKELKETEFLLPLPIEREPDDWTDDWPHDWSEVDPNPYDDVYIIFVLFFILLIIGLFVEFSLLGKIRGLFG